MMNVYAFELNSFWQSISLLLYIEIKMNKKMITKKAFVILCLTIYKRLHESQVK